MVQEPPSLVWHHRRRDAHWRFVCGGGGPVGVGRGGLGCDGPSYRVRLFPIDLTAVPRARDSQPPATLASSHWPAAPPGPALTQSQAAVALGTRPLHLTSHPPGALPTHTHTHWSLKSLTANSDTVAYKMQKMLQTGSLRLTRRDRLAG